MTKFNKFLSFFLCICVVVGGLSVVASAATGESVITLVKNVVDKWFVNGEEVTEEEYAAAMEVQYEDYVIEHHLNTGVQYRINGVIVTEEEALAYIAASNNSSNTNEDTSSIVITKDDLTSWNSGQLSDYLTFETDGQGILTGVKVKSNKVTSITYKYNSSYLGFSSQNNNGDYYFAYTNGVVYRDVTDTSGLVFKVGNVTSTNFYVANEEGEATSNNVEVGYYVFKFVNDPNRTPITFENIFESITLTYVE